MTAPKKKEEAKAYYERLRNFMRARAERGAGPYLLAAPPKPLSPEERRSKFEARVIRSSDGELFVAKKIDPSRIPDLRRQGFKLAPSKEGVSHRTIYGDEIYMLMDVSPEAHPVKSPRTLMPNEVVEVEVERDERGRSTVLDIREIRR